MASTCRGTGDGTAVVQATSTSTADAEASGGSGGGVSVNVFLPSASVNGVTRAFIGEGASVTAVGVEVLADALQAKATADSLSLRFSAFGGSGVETQATVGRTVDAFIGADAGEDAGSTSARVTANTVKLDADGSLTATAKADGGGASGIDIQAMLPTATVDGTVRAYVRDGADVRAGSLTIAAGTDADPVVLEASATSLVIAFSGAGGSGIRSNATVSGTVAAFVGAPIDMTPVSIPGNQVVITGAATVDAVSEMRATALADGGGASGLSVTVMLPSATR